MTDGWDHADLDGAALDGALAAFDEVPLNFPGRPRLAAELMIQMLQAGLVPDQARIDRAIELGELGLLDPEPPDGFRECRALVHATSLAWRAMGGGEPVTPRRALAEFDRLAADIGDREPFAGLLRLLRGNIGAVREFTDQDLSGDGWSATLAALGLDGPEAEVLALMARLNTAMQHDDWDAVPAMLRDLRDRAGRLPAGHWARVEVTDMVTAMHGAGLAEADPADVEELRRSIDEPGLPDVLRASRRDQLARALRVSRPDEAITWLRQATELAAPDDPRRAHYLHGLGEALLARHDTTGERADLDAAVDAFERALRAAGSPAHRYWAVASWALGSAYRRAGRAADGREVARRGLRGRAWGVLLQGGTPAAQVAVRDAARHALEIARWCLEDQDAAGAALTLDAGRGLILHAATQTYDVPARLIERGEPGLAAQWRAADPAEPPDDLRYRVMSVLAGASTGPDRLLDPPGLDEVRAALGVVGADALVYLMPGDEGRPGAAVVVFAAEPPAHLWLPELSADTAAVAAVLDGGRDAAARGGPVEEVYDWAWRVAIGPLLELFRGRPRLVLVPVGELARVAWPAARRRVPGGHEYALERAVFSYAVSARMLCDVAWRPPAPLTGAGLVVGDPDTAGAAPDLPGARAEALAIHRDFYPAGDYLGRLADGRPAPAGAAGRAQVLDRLTGGTLGTVLHLACHGVVRAGGISTAGTAGTAGAAGTDDSSYLLLAGGAHFAAEELTRVLAARTSQDVGLAVLAACSGAASGRGYDEAFSIATALLAGGVRSVVSALWSVPDDATSVLMYRFHANVRTAGLPPREALREAQLWLLDPHREVPGTMPEPLYGLAARLGTVPPSAWAGFIHQGR